MESPYNPSTVNAKIILLRRLLDDPQRFDEAKALLLQVHAWLHAREMGQTKPWSYQDEVLEGLAADDLRVVPAGEEHSIAWLLWHLARCEDITMNLLIAGSDQVLLAEGWLTKLTIPWQDTGNTMTPQEIADFSNQVDIVALLAYRVAVGRRTHEIIEQETATTIHHKVKAADVKRILTEGAVLEEAHFIVDYWSKRDHAGLYLMPATRHILTHLRKAQDISRKVLRMKHD